MTYLESLRSGLYDAFELSNQVVIIGEDIQDPYGGAFKITKGLSSKFPDRVFNAPISEAGFTGLSVGLAIRGMLPVVEIMFGDFITLCADQIINHMTKFSSMYPGVSVPIVIRTPMGGGRGYGATHSQSLEKLFFGIPNLKIISPSLAHNPGELLKFSILVETGPLLFIENKTLYSKTLLINNTEDIYVRTINEKFPISVLTNTQSEKYDIHVISYGGPSLSIFNIMKKLIEDEISIKSIFPSLISPFELDSIFQEIKDAKKILIVEDGSEGFNWGSEVACQIYESSFFNLEKPIKRLSAKDEIIPCADKLEKEILVTEEKIEKFIMELLV